MIIKTDSDKSRMLYGSRITGGRSITGKAAYDKETHELMAVYFELTEEETEMYKQAGGPVFDTYIDWNEWEAKYKEQENG